MVIRARKQNQSRKGFTLVELIVVLVIVAILAAVAVPACLAYIDNAREKQYITRGKSALQSTQATLSAIYTNSEGRLTPDRREATKKVAQAGDDTAFTVWTAQPLKDGTTSAVEAEFGSYTVKKALYKENDSNYVAYDGKNWQVFATESEAKDFLALGELSGNVIYMWPYKSDLAYNGTGGNGGSGGNGGGNGGSGNNGTEQPGGEQEDGTFIKYVTLNADQKHWLFFTDFASKADSGAGSVTVMFWRTPEGKIESNWTKDEESGADLLKAGGVAYGYDVRLYCVFGGWKDNATNAMRSGLSDIQRYIFSDEYAETINFSFTATVTKEEIGDDIATIDKNKFAAKFNGTVNDVVQVPTEQYTLETVTGVSGATSVEKSDVLSEKKIYAWKDGTVVYWWTDASVCFLPEDCVGMFKNNKNLVHFNFTGFDVSRVTSMKEMFYGCSSLTGVTFGNDFYADSLTNISSMFAQCTTTTSLDLRGFKAAGGTLQDISFAFDNMNKMTKVTFGTAFDTSNVRNAKGIFYNCKSLTGVDLSAWDLDMVENAYRMFYACYALKKVELADECKMTSCKTMEDMFRDCRALNQDFHQIKTSANLENMAGMFYGASGLEKLDLTGFDPQNVTSFAYTFRDAQVLTTLDISTWKGAKAPVSFESITNICLNCYNLRSIDFSGFDAGKLKTAKGAFMNCYALEKADFSNWKGTKAPHLEGSLESMFDGCYRLEGALDFSDWDVTLVTDMRFMFRNCKYVTSIDISGWNTENVTNAYRMFLGCVSLQSLEFGEGLHLEACTTMAEMFKNCIYLTNADFSKLYTSGELTSMNATFEGCFRMGEINLENVNSANVTDMYHLFYMGAWDGNNYDLGTAEHRKADFRESAGLSEITFGENFSTANVSNMEGMFGKCMHLTKINGLESFNTSNVTNMKQMFWCTGSLAEIDCSSFDTANVTNFTDMFTGFAKNDGGQDLNKLSKIYASDSFVVAGDTQMFANDYELVGGAGTVYAEANKTAAYAHIDTSENPGYFTAK